MIEDGDKIAVGISGGKDSLALLYAFAGLRTFYPKKFQIIAVTVDLGFGEFNLEGIKKLCQKLEVEYYVLKTNELVNDRVFNLSEHKDLALNLLCACGSGGWNKHAWIAISRDARLDKVDTIVKNFYKLNDDEWNLKKDVIDSKEVLNYLGLNDKGK